MVSIFIWTFLKCEYLVVFLVIYVSKLKILVFWVKEEDVSFLSEIASGIFICLWQWKDQNIIWVALQNYTKLF